MLKGHIVNVHERLDTPQDLSTDHEEESTMNQMTEEGLLIDDDYDLQMYIATEQSNKSMKSSRPQLLIPENIINETLASMKSHKAIDFSGTARYKS